MQITTQDLKNILLVASTSGKERSFSAQIKDRTMDVFIRITFYPELNIKKDIYPYWHIEKRDEDLSVRISLPQGNLSEVKDIYNTFVAVRP